MGLWYLSVGASPVADISPLPSSLPEVVDTGMLGGGTHSRATSYWARLLMHSSPKHMSPGGEYRAGGASVILLLRDLQCWFAIQGSRNRDDVHSDYSSSSSAWRKGLSISSLPSTGEMRTRRVPRQTRRPRGREVWLPSSSVFFLNESLLVLWGFGIFIVTYPERLRLPRRARGS